MIMPWNFGLEAQVALRISDTLAKFKVNTIAYFGTNEVHWFME